MQIYKITIIIFLFSTLFYNIRNKNSIGRRQYLDPKDIEEKCRLKSREVGLGSLYYPFPNIKECNKDETNCNKNVWNRARQIYKNCVNSHYTMPSYSNFT